MILLLSFIQSVWAVCQGSNYCTDVTGLLLCLRAQDQVNALILNTNDSMPLLSLNCAAYSMSDDYHYNVKASQFFSTKNNQNCLHAQKIYVGLLIKYSKKNLLAIDCETIDGVKDDGTKLSLSLFIVIAASILMAM